MRTKKRFAAAVRLLCFTILLAATAIRFGSELYERRPVKAAQPEPTYPTMLFEKSEANIFANPDNVRIDNQTEFSIDIKALMAKDTDFLISDKPVVLVIHTHATEAYCETVGARTTDTALNIVHIGEVLTNALNKNGITTLHETSLIDHEDYYGAYPHAAELIEGYLMKHPSIQMVIDVHRDAVTDKEGNELALTADLNGVAAARLMLVMGSDSAGLSHQNWEENLAFALKLQAFCEERAPGIFRDLTLRTQRYNQHLTPKSILLEVGAAGNSMQEAETSIRFFADQLSRLIYAS